MHPENYNHRPYNSIRFLCRCGVIRTFPRAPAGGRKAESKDTLPDGTVKIVTMHSKEVHCACGMVTEKERCDFTGR